MKKTLVLLCFSFLTLQLVKGQKTDTAMNKSPQALHDRYMQKRKTNNIVGWVMLGSGIGMTIGGLAINVGEGFAKSNTKGLWLSYLGGATTLASIPFFISAGSNKRKAKLALKRESVSFGNKILYKSNYTALALIIPSGYNQNFQK